MTIGVTSIVAFGAGYLMGRHSQQPVVTTVVQRVEVPAKQVPQIATVASISNSTPVTSLTSFSDRGRGGTGAKVAAPPPSGTSSSGSALTEELDLLRRAERTIRAGDAMVALGLLSELDARFPRGQLLEERAAARVMANCQLTDATSARSMGEAYLRAHSQSVYAARVRSLCHLDAAMKDSPPSGHKGE
jgi:hypothetical protein